MGANPVTASLSFFCTADHDEVVRTALTHRSGDSSLFSALRSLGSTRYVATQRCRAPAYLRLVHRDIREVERSPRGRCSPGVVPQKLIRKVKVGTCLRHLWAALQVRMPESINCVSM